MTQEATTPEDMSADPQDALYNSFHEGTYVETLDEGYVFSFGEGLEALVELEEYGYGARITDDLKTTLLIERPKGDYWLASSRKAEKLAYYERLEKMAADGAEIEGIITGVNRGGLSVDAGVRAFVPKSQVDAHRVDDFTPYVGRKSRFKVIEFKRDDATLVLSRRKIVERENKKVRQDVLAKLEKGEVFEGVVRTVKPYGVFVDVGGGVEGLLHVTNIAWGRIDHPNELFRPGDDVRVMVLDYDKKKKRLELGRKQLLEDPWAALGEEFVEGAVVRGKVVSLADFGAFVELKPGLEGLVHVTELSWTQRVDHPSNVLELGQDVGVKIIGVDTEEKRMSLSIKQLETNPWDVLSDEMPAGTVFTGPIRSITEFGLFVEARPGLEGLVHVSNLSWTERGDEVIGNYKIGDDVEVKVLSVNPEEERLELGIKQLEADPWEEAEQLAVVGKKIDVVITKLAKFGAFAQIVEGAEGLIPMSELSEDRVDDPIQVVRPGQTVNVLVMSFDRANQRISLSLRRDEIDEELMTEYRDDDTGTATLGDILREQLGAAALGGTAAEEE